MPHRPTARVVVIASLVCGLALRETATAVEAAPELDVPTEAPALTAPVAPVPPRLLTDARVPYPEAATGDASVLLELLIDADGAVGEVAVVAGEEPFATTAKVSAYTWRFSPAVHNGVVRAARIRFELRFAEPEAEPDPSAEPPPNASPTPPPPVAVIEVTARSQRKPVGTRSLTQAEVRQLPGAFGDPFRAIEALPGVTPLATGVPFFYVRGAPPGNVGYFLDGIRVPLLYHVGLGPSVVHPGMVASVDLYPGAYPARHGRFGGGVVAGLTKQPASELSGQWQVRLFDTGAMVEAPLGDKGHLLVGGRYSYTAAVIALFADNVRLEYWDYQLRASYDLSPRDTISVFSFGSFDYFGEEEEDDDDDDPNFFGTEFHRVDLRHRRLIGADSQLSSAVTLGYDRTRGGEGLAVVSPSIGARSTYETAVSPRLRLEAGLSLTVEEFGVNLNDDDAFRDEPPSSSDAPPPPETGPGVAADTMPPAGPSFEEDRQDDDPNNLEINLPTRTDVAMGGHVEAEWKATPRITLTPGLRIDLFMSDGAWALGIDPRITASFELGKHWTVSHALGLAHQPPSFVIPVPGFQLGGLRGGLQRSVQNSAAVRYQLPDDMSVSATLFHNQFFGLTDILSLVRNVRGDDLDVDTRTRGHSYGVEVLVRRALTRKLGGFLAYTLSRSERLIKLTRFPAAFDRPHVLNAALGYDLGRGWRAGGRFVYYSGTPPSQIVSAAVDIGGPFGSTETLVVEPASRPARLPGFYRLDTRLEKRWMIGNNGASWSLVLEVLNVTLNTEVVELDCGVIGSQDGGQYRLRETCSEQRIGPVTIPSIGVEGQF